MPADKTIDTVLMIIAGGLLTMGLVSMLIGWLARVWDRIVNRSQVVASPAQTTDRQTDQTDRQTNPVFAGDEWLDRLEVDRSKAALIELLVYSGWQVGEIRNVVKGDSTAIGVEVAAARQRLGIDPLERTLRVKDERGERVIPI